MNISGKLIKYFYELDDTERQKMTSEITGACLLLGVGASVQSWSGFIRSYSCNFYFLVRVPFYFILATVCVGV